MIKTTITSTGPVVTLFESYGSGAESVGRKVAQALGVSFLSQLYSSEQLEAAETAESDEDNAFMRVLKMFGHENTDHLDNNILLPSDQSDQNARVQENNRTLIEGTAKGGVVLGRNATVVLAGNPRALHVKLDGPVEARVARAAADAGIDPDRAARRQVHEDDVRAAMSFKLYHWDPRENDRYDLVINTAHLDLDAVTAIIVAASRAKAASVA
ncbi:MAG: cytidylate kinase family protein [Micropruina sp.]